MTRPLSDADALDLIRPAPLLPDDSEPLAVYVVCGYCNGSGEIKPGFRCLPCDGEGRFVVRECSRHGCTSKDCAGCAGRE